VTRPGALDEVCLRCEPASTDVDREALRRRVQRALHEQTGLSFAVDVLDPRTLPRSEGKALRVVDHRSV
jgi:phenylacetate-CoA ligase